MQSSGVEKVNGVTMITIQQKIPLVKVGDLVQMIQENTFSGPGLLDQDLWIRRVM